ncbi:MAG: Ku protein [Hydrogenophaga sp.]|nr:Ku protein [Hydrogenophaga sp.]MDO9434478.1 Ku protein [Hydrogenophaga sp.]
MWKGAISFGLVHIPVGLYSATASTGVDFDWLDRRSMEPVGYKRINKVTGKEVAMADIVKGVEVEDGHYVVLTPEEIASAYPKTTQTIEIETFVDADEIPFVYLERPYYTAPLKRGEKVYALLRESLQQSHKVGVAKVVIQTKQHLAVLIPCGRALVLNLLRWGGEIRSFEQLDLPPVGAKAAGIKDAELKMAMQLIEDMTESWQADSFRNSFADEIHKLVETKAASGKVTRVEKPDEDEAKGEGTSNVLDLTALLKRSLGEKRGGGKSAKAEPASVIELPTAKKPAAKKTTAKSTAAKKAGAQTAAAKKPASKQTRRAA